MRKLARERWMKRRAALAKTRAARYAAYEVRWKDLRTRRAERRARRLAGLRAQWEVTFLSNEQVRAEMLLHGERTARLRQMLRLAEVDNRAKIAVRIQLALGREERRHKRRMTTLKLAFTANAGGPQ